MAGRMKKPLNVIEAPIYPDIRKMPPRFVWSRKHWNVDAGATLRDLEHNTQAFSHAVLAQSRDYNKTIYGQSSHRDVVNKAFRPPLRTVEDFEPLSRLRRKLTVPRINPNADFGAQNDGLTNIDAHLTDRVQEGLWRPTFFCKIERPEDNSVLPDLELTLPMHTADAGMNTPVQIDAPLPDISLDYNQIDPALFSGLNVPVRLDAEIQTPELERTLPSRFATSFINTPFRSVPQTQIPELDRTLPEFSVVAGVNTPFRAMQEITMKDLQRGIPRYSTTARINNPINLNAEDPRKSLQLDSTLQSRFYTNPAVKQFDGQKYTLQSDKMTKVCFTSPQVSVHAHKNMRYKSNNYQSHKPFFRTKLQPRGAISSENSIPIFGR